MCQKHVCSWGEQPFSYTLRSWPLGAGLLENGQVLFPTLPIVLSASLKKAQETSSGLSSYVRYQETRILGKCSRTESHPNPSLEDPRQTFYHQAIPPTHYSRFAKFFLCTFAKFQEFIHHRDFFLILVRLDSFFKGAWSLSAVSSLLDRCQLATQAGSALESFLIKPST